MGGKKKVSERRQLSKATLIDKRKKADVKEESKKESKKESKEEETMADATTDQSWIPKGLQNVGNTCFFNSVVQAVSACVNESFPFHLLPPSPGFLTETFVSTVKANSQTIDPAGIKSSSTNPSKLLTAVSRISPQFKGRRQQDAHEVYVAIMAGLDDEKLKYLKDNDETDICVPSSLFTGSHLSIITCDECHARTDRVETSFDTSCAIPGSEHLLTVKSYRPPVRLPTRIQRKIEDDELTDKLIITLKNCTGSTEVENEEINTISASLADLKVSDKTEGITENKDLSETEPPSILEMTENITESVAIECQSKVKIDSCEQEIDFVRSHSKSTLSSIDPVKEVTNDKIADNDIITSSNDAADDMQFIQEMQDIQNNARHACLRETKSSDNRMGNSKNNEAEDFVEDVLEVDTVEVLILGILQDVVQNIVQDEVENVVEGTKYILNGVKNSVTETIPDIANEELKGVEEPVLLSPSTQPDSVPEKEAVEKSELLIPPCSDLRRNSNEEVSLNDCLQAFTHIESLSVSDGNGFYCAKCSLKKGLVNAKKRILLSDCPAILSVHLKRLLPGGKFTGHIGFPLKLNIKDFVAVTKNATEYAPIIDCNIDKMINDRDSTISDNSSDKENDRKDGHNESVSKEVKNGEKNTSFLNQDLNNIHEFKDILYDLAAVVVHQGGALGGHYIAYVRNKKGDWYYASDTTLKGCSESEVLRANAYMLFYESQDVSWLVSLKELVSKIVKKEECEEENDDKEEDEKIEAEKNGKIKIISDSSLINSIDSYHESLDISLHDKESERETVTIDKKEKTLKDIMKEGRLLRMGGVEEIEKMEEGKEDEIENTIISSRSTLSRRCKTITVNEINF